MLKILVGCAFACVISTSAAWAVAADVVSSKVAGASLQKVKFTVQKNVYSQIDRSSVPARARTMHAANPETAMPESAQLGLLLTALLCFVARASRRKV